MNEHACSGVIFPSANAAADRRRICAPFEIVLRVFVVVVLVCSFLFVDVFYYVMKKHFNFFVLIAHHYLMISVVSYLIIGIRYR